MMALFAWWIEVCQSVLWAMETDYERKEGDDDAYEQEVQQLEWFEERERHCATKLMLHQQWHWIMTRLLDAWKCS